MKTKNNLWISAFLLGSALAISPAVGAAETDMMKDEKGMTEKGAMKDAKGMMKDEKGMMKAGKDSMSKDKIKAEKTGNAMADDKMMDEKMKMDDKTKMDQKK